MNYLAQRDFNNPLIETGTRSETGVGFFERVVPFAVTAGLVLGIVVFFFIFAMGAVRWITAGGDKVAIESARDTISKALLGIFVLLLVFLIMNFIGTFFGTDILLFNLDNLIIGN
jgi:hypothetical protein